jgi:hypothetical protein
MQPDVDVTGLPGDQDRGMDPTVCLDARTAKGDVRDSDRDGGEEAGTDDVELDDAEHPPDGDRHSRRNGGGDALATQRRSAHVFTGSSWDGHGDGIQHLADRIVG